MDPKQQRSNLAVYIYVILTSVITSLFIIFWLFAYEELTKLVWHSSLATTNRWAFPVLAIFFSLLVGLSIKYLKAPTSMDGSLLESLSGSGEKPSWRELPATFLTSIFTLLSGAVLGPEGAIGHLALQLADFVNDKFKIGASERDKITYASLATGYNGLIASPVFTAVLANDVVDDAEVKKKTLPSNLIAGAIGYVIFALIVGKGFANFLKLEQLSSLKLVYVGYAMIFAFLGVLLAAVLPFVFKFAEKVFARFSEKVVLRSLVAGSVIGLVGYFAPVLMFSGEAQIHTLISEPLTYGFALLIVMALAKLVMLGISFKSGFLGGPIFPCVFAATCVALAFSLLLPGVPLILLIAAVVTALLTAVLRAPFMVILFTSFFLGADMNLLSLIIISAGVVMILLPMLDARKKPAKA